MLAVSQTTIRKISFSGLAWQSSYFQSKQKILSAKLDSFSFHKLEMQEILQIFREENQEFSPTDSDSGQEIRFKRKSNSNFSSKLRF